MKKVIRTVAKGQQPTSAFESAFLEELNKVNTFFRGQNRRLQSQVTTATGACGAHSHPAELRHAPQSVLFAV